MNKFLKIFFLVAVSVLVLNCSKSDDTTASIVTPIADFQTQYNTDNLAIEKFLKENKVTVDAGFNPTFSRVTLNDPSSIFIENQNNASNPTKLLFRMVNSNGVDYKLYYLQINKGGGARPTNLDSILASYQGNIIENKAVTTLTTETDIIGFQFDIRNDPETYLPLISVIKAWNQVFPQFNGAVISTNANGGKVYSDFGSGVIFVPSGLGYYNQIPNGQNSTNFPQYSNLLFKFKLNEVIRTDNENNGTNVFGDGILSIDEDLNGDYYFTSVGTGVGKETDDDTDNDGIVDALDLDDDNDKYLTNFEIKKPFGSSGSANYLFNEIPDCSKNTTNPNRLKRHLDPNCHD